MARQIGEIARSVIGRTLTMYGFQQMLDASPADQRDGLIISAAEHGEISRDDARLLLRERRTGQ